jgi:glycosyltransferase involved in cell wall biosynthesis
MKKLGVFVGENQWSFFREIFDDLSRHYAATVFTRRAYRTPIGENRLNAFVYARDLKRTLRENDVCFFEWASDLLMHASRFPKSCAMVTRLHSFELFEWAPQIDWRVVDRVILVSHAMRERFVALYPAHASKARVVFNGRPLDAFGLDTRGPFRFHLGMACHITPIKRVYEAILLVQQLRADGHSARLFIAGTASGDLRYDAAVRRLVTVLDLEDSVFFDGHVDDMPSWLQKIDVFLSNSFWEGQQVALLEAMAAGCYCLSHHWAGAEEMLPSDHLFVTDAELRSKLAEYARASNGTRAAAQNRLRTLARERFDVRNTVLQIRAIVDELAATHV